MVQIQIMYEFEIWEFYDDAPSEPFGFEAFNHIPEVGEEITLHWEHGKPAYIVQVISVDETNMELHTKFVRHIDEKRKRKRS